VRRPVSTVGLVLRRCGLDRLAALEVRPPVIRYEREHPGELIHIDSKKLGRIDGIGHRITGDRMRQSSKRGTGWEALHVAIDDASRLAYTEILPDEKTTSATAFLARALAFFARHGVTAERVMTDNGSAYKSHRFRDMLPKPEFATSAHGPTRRAPTARSNASSRRACANGSMQDRSKHRLTEPLPCPTGSATTTANDHTPPSAENRQSHD
jgi:transposase InsO family protein